MRRLLVVPLAAAVLWLAACEPAPPPPAPPPPTTAAPPLYEGCGNVGPFRCGLSYVNELGIGTYARAWASTSEPPTFISFVFVLEQAQPDGSWTGIFTDRYGGGSVTQHREQTSAIIHCAKGRYRWRLEVRFSGRRTTYTSTSASFLSW